jgi:hypothetical protein
MRKKFYKTLGITEFRLVHQTPSVCRWSPHEVRVSHVSPQNRKRSSFLNVKFCRTLVLYTPSEILKSTSFRQNCHFAFGPLDGAPLFSWGWRLYNSAYEALFISSWYLIIFYRTSFDESQYIVLGPIWRASILGARLSIFTGHWSLIDELFNVEYE